MLAKEPKADLEELKREGIYIGEKLQDPRVGDCNFLKDNEIDRAKLEKCYFSGTHAEFRKENNVNAKFCIYITDKQGRIITLTDVNDDQVSGFGFNDLQLYTDSNDDAVYCGEKVTP